MSWFRLRVKESRLTGGVLVSLKVNRKDVDQYNMIIAVFEMLQRISQVSDNATWEHLVCELEALEKSEEEAHIISSLLNGCGHEHLSPDEVGRLAKRHRELKSYANNHG